MSYKDELNNLTDISFDKILRLAKDNVPANRKNTPWIGLEHGIKVLDNDGELAQYIAAYGICHREKINAALDTIRNPKEFFLKNLTIIDWGCGQGLATICFYDYMRKLGIEPSVKKIILIEPSAAAIARANEYLAKYTASADISLVNKYINDVEPSDINVPDNSIVLHFLSNILDIQSVNLSKLTGLIKCITTEQLFFCVGPQNAGASRIADFAKMLNIGDSDLKGRQNGYLSDEKDRTISMMVFHIKANITKIMKIENYRRGKTDLENNTALNRVLADIQQTTSPSGRALQFYKAVVELERMKTTVISEVFNYPYTLATESRVRFNIDIQDNKEFELLFVENMDKKKTKWPKNLNVGLSFLFKDTVYRLFEYIYPYEDLKEIDITKEYISVDLSMFSVSAAVADRLQLDNDGIDEFTAILTDPNAGLSDLETALKNTIGQTVTLCPQLSLTLTAESPVLAQITSELRALYGRDDNSLLQSFLTGNLKKNIADKVSEDDIINVVDMDDSQRQAITRALNSRISVVTGPPGTGKTQMIVNLIANAMLKNKSVLVASKNNKAVDNIKERFDLVDDSHYLLRFGSRDVISSKLLPALETWMNNIQDLQYDAAGFSKMISKYKQACTVAHNARESLGELVRLIDSVPEIEKRIQDLNENRRTIEFDYSTAMENLRSANSDIDEDFFNGYDWDKISIDLQKNINNLQSNDYGLRRLFFNLFSKRKYAAQILNDILSLPSAVKDRIEHESGIRNVSDVRNCRHLIDFCEIELKQVKRICSYGGKLSQIKHNYSSELIRNEEKINTANRDLADINKRIKALKDIQDQQLENIRRSREQISSMSVELLSGLIRSRLASTEARQAIARYRNYLPNNIPWRNQDIPTFVSDASNFIDVFRLNSVTSLSAKSAFPMTNGFFDIVVIDEASQCDVASALPLIYRAGQVVVIGDPMQLKHITSVTSEEESRIKEYLSLNENPFARYVDHSLWDYCNDLITSADTNNTTVMLDCHYRCHPQIIGYSNEMFYKKLGKTLKVCYQDNNNGLRQKGMIWVDVVGEQMSDTINVNAAEVDKAISLATEIAEQAPKVSIGIISPFKHQAEAINARIPENLRERIISDTVHKFQGDERDVIIYSTVVTDNSPWTKIRWIDKSVPNLVNVAVTRARSLFYIVGNRQYIRANSGKNLPLGYLVEYTDDHHVVPNACKEIIIIDTNVFVNCPDILDHIDSSKQIVISAKVVDELDSLKVKFDGAKKSNVESALKNINRNFGRYNIKMECADLECLPVDFNRKISDNMILSVALKYRSQNPVLLTSDNGLQLKAKGLEIKTVSLREMLNN